jgi:branched-chain amino acid transport system substrate-binding protein
MKKNNLLVLITLMLSVLALSSNLTMPSHAQTRPTIKIGALGPLAITPGADMKKAVELAVEEINGGAGVDVNGVANNFELFIETTSGTDGLPDPTTGVTNLVKLKTDHQVVAIIGGFRTEVVVGIQQNLGATPFIGVGSTAPIITPYFWRVGPTNGTELAYSIIELYGIFLKNHGVNKFTIVREDASWTLALGPAINATLKSNSFNMTSTSDIVVSQGASQEQVTAAMTPANVAGYSDALLTLFSAPVGKQVTIAWSSLNMTQYLAGINVEAQKSTYFQDTQGAAYGEIELETASPDTNVTAKSGAFKQAYFDKYGELPTYTSFASYDAVYVLKSAIERAKAADSVSIQNYLNTTDYTGASFRIKFTNAPIPNYFNSSITVSAAHDLFTPDGVGTAGGDYANPVFIQWQQGGIKKSVYSTTADVAGANLQWPILHGDYNLPTSSTDSEAPPAPGFEIYTALIGIMAIFLISQNKKRKLN